MTREPQDESTFAEELAESLRQAIAYARGDRDAPVRVVRRTVRNTAVTPVPSYTAEEVRAIRTRLGYSQPIFALALGVTADAVQAWEQGKRGPNGAARRLLQVAERAPETFREAVAGVHEPTSR